MVSKKTAHIIGMGSYLPERILTNSDLEKMVETSDEWIVSRTGMKERRIAAENEHSSDMGAAAAQKALADAAVAAGDIDLILVATMTPDHLCPSTAAIIQHKLGAAKAAVADVQAACTGYLYALSMAKAYIESGMYKTILVIATEKMSAFIDYTDRNTCVLFGDGASASVVSSQSKGLQIEGICLGADGELSELIIVPAGGGRMPASHETVVQAQHFLKLSGKEVFRHAVRRMGAAAQECLELCGYTEKEMRWMIPHQANLRIIDAIAKQMDIPDDKVYKTVHKYGNSSASSVAIALDEALKEKVVQKGDHLLLVAFGGGLTWGAAILTKVSGD